MKCGTFFFTIYTIDQGKAIIKVEEFKSSQNLKHDTISKCSKCSIYCFINYSKITMKDIFLTSQRKQVFYWLLSFNKINIPSMHLIKSRQPAEMCIYTKLYKPSRLNELYFT